MPKERQRSILGWFGGPPRALWGVLLGHVGGSAELLVHLLGPKWSQKRQHEGLKSDLGSSRGGQGVPEALQESIFVGFFYYFWIYFGMFRGTFSEGFHACRSLVSHGILMFLVLMSVWLLHRFQ